VLTHLARGAEKSAERCARKHAAGADALDAESGKLGHAPARHGAYASTLTGRSTAPTTAAMSSLLARPGA
jgi:hypothetical protein